MHENTIIGRPVVWFTGHSSHIKPIILNIQVANVVGQHHIFFKIIFSFPFHECTGLSEKQQINWIWPKIYGMLTHMLNQYFFWHTNSCSDSGLCWYEIHNLYRYLIFKIQNQIASTDTYTDIWYAIHWNFLWSKEAIVKTQRCNLFVFQLLSVWYIPTLTSIDLCNINLSNYLYQCYNILV